MQHLPCMKVGHVPSKPPGLLSAVAGSGALRWWTRGSAFHSRNFVSMCYNTSLDTDVKAMNARYKRVLLEETRGEGLPFLNVSAFARPWWPVVTAQEFGWRQWGLVPVFAKRDPAAFLKKSLTYNAISEEAAKKPSFRSAWNAGQRALIPVTHFKEWQHRPVEGRKTPNKVPFEIKLQGGGIFSLAGLYDGDTYTILTRPANTLMAEIHNSKKRMPVIIPQDQEEAWLDPELSLNVAQAMCDAVHEFDLVATEAA